jgi:hypothetical protein
MYPNPGRHLVRKYFLYCSICKRSDYLNSLISCITCYFLKKYYNFYLNFIENKFSYFQVLIIM